MITQISTDICSEVLARHLTKEPTEIFEETLANAQPEFGDAFILSLVRRMMFGEENYPLYERITASEWILKSSSLFYAILEYHLTYIPRFSPEIILAATEDFMANTSEHEYLKVISQTQPAYTAMIAILAKMVKEHETFPPRLKNAMVNITVSMACIIYRLAEISFAQSSKESIN